MPGLRVPWSAVFQGDTRMQYKVKIDLGKYKKTCDPTKGLKLVAICREKNPFSNEESIKFDLLCFDNRSEHYLLLTGYHPWHFTINNTTVCFVFQNVEFITVETKFVGELFVVKNIKHSIEIPQEIVLALEYLHGGPF